MSFPSAVAAFLIAEIALAAIMAGAWAVERATGRTGWIDAIWTFGVGATAAALAVAPLGHDSGSGWRRGAVATAVALWALRLGGHIVARTLKTPDDPRYRKLIDVWGDAAPLRLFAFLQVQALTGAALTLAVTLAAQASSPHVRIQDVLQDLVGLLIFIVALAGEAIADAQLARFKADPTRRGQICDLGLWSRSRHPNYFFEWLVWVAFAVAASRDVVGLFAWVAPALMYCVLRYASGVPPLEEHMLRTRGEDFRAYQRRTAVFFPRLL
jgi:steroid 5-alpha reductase family enzyme